jgi:hypothetical protein
MLAVIDLLCFLLPSNKSLQIVSQARHYDSDEIYGTLIAPQGYSHDGPIEFVLKCGCCWSDRLAELRPVQELLCQ